MGTQQLINDKTMIVNVKDPCLANLIFPCPLVEPLLGS